MASGKVARRAVVDDVAAILDSPEIAGLIEAIDAIGSTRGRKGYGTRTLIGAVLIRGIYGLRTWTFTAALIREHPALRAVIGGARRTGRAAGLQRSCERTGTSSAPASTRAPKRSAA